MFSRRGKNDGKNGGGEAGEAPAKNGRSAGRGRGAKSQGSAQGNAQGSARADAGAGDGGASRERGKALREGARQRAGETGKAAAGLAPDARPGAAAPAEGGRSRKPTFARSGASRGYASPGSPGNPANGSYEAAPGTFRPQGSLLPEPVPSAENLPEPEKLFGTKRDLLSRLTAYAMAGSLILALFLLLFLPLRYILTGGGGSDSQGPAAAASEAGTEARALAEPFAAAYLEVNPGEGPEASQARVTPFLATDLPADVVATQNEGETERRVLSTSVYRTEKLRDDRWVVYTENLVSTTSPNAPVQDPLAAESLTETGSSFAAPDGESTTTVRRVGLLVYVAASGGPSGGVAVDAPPRIVAPRGGFDGEPGAIVAEEPQTLSEGPVRDLLEGYFAAAYGSDVSRESITNFLAPGAAPPPQPALGLEFLGLEDGVVYEAPAPRGSDWGQTYEVEAYVSVRDPEAGTTSTQTHVLTVAETDDGWKVAGGPGSVGG